VSGTILAPTGFKNALSAVTVRARLLERFSHCCSSSAGSPVGGAILWPTAQAVGFLGADPSKPRRGDRPADLQQQEKRVSHEKAPFLLSVPARHSSLITRHCLFGSFGSLGSLGRIFLPSFPLPRILATGGETTSPCRFALWRPRAATSPWQGENGGGRAEGWGKSKSR